MRNVRGFSSSNNQSHNRMTTTTRNNRALISDRLNSSFSEITNSNKTANNDILTSFIDKVKKDQVGKTEVSNRRSEIESKQMRNSRLCMTSLNSISNSRQMLPPSSKFQSEILNTAKKVNTGTSAINRNRRGTTTIKNNSYHEQEYIVSIIENYAKEVGISAFNIRTMQIFVTQLIDNEAYINSITMINYWRPLEVVMNQVRI